MKLKDYLPTHCSTSGLIGLSNQIANILLADQPGLVIDVSAHVNIVGASTIPFLQKQAGEALIAAIAEKGSKPKLVHALRVLPQQAALSHWYQHERCDIPLAATPGTSPHERGIAIDINSHAAWKTVLRNHDWKWRGTADPPHFNYHGGHDPDFGIEGIRSFQKLWNLHNAADQIDEDGVLGPITLKRLGLSPVEGFS